MALPCATSGPLGIASGFLIETRYLVTAGHVISGGGSLGGSLEAEDAAVVFGYYGSAASNDDYGPRFGDTYGIRRVIHAEYSPMAGDTVDYSVVELERPVQGYRPFPVAPASSAAPGSPISVFGHPAGDALVRFDGYMANSDADSPYLRAALACFGGLSGAPVVDSENRLIGMLAGIEGLASPRDKWNEQRRLLNARCHCSTLPWPEHPCECPATRITGAGHFARWAET